MQKIIDDLTEQANSLEERAKQAADKQAEADAEIEKVTKEIGDNKGADSIKRKEFQGLKELSDDMSELRNKWVKDADKKNMQAVNLAMAQPNAIHTFILDSLATYFAGEPTTYADHKEDFFADEQVYGQQVRKCKPEKVEKNLVKTIAHRVNCDAEGVEGDVQKFMTEKLNAAENLPFYVHYKLLFKLTQMAISRRKMAGIGKSLGAATEKNKGLEVQKKTWETISENLSFGKLLQSEAERMRNEEIAVLTRKHEALKEEIAKIEEKDFVKEYFEALME